MTDPTREDSTYTHTQKRSLAWENFRMAMGSLVSTKLRTFLTLLGLMIGVGTVIAMLAVITGFNNAMRKQISSLGSGILYVTKYEAGIHFGGRERLRWRKDLTLEDAQAVAELCPSVSAVSPEMSDQAYLSAGRTKTSSVSVTGATPSFCDVNNWYPGDGRFFTATEVSHRDHVCVLGKSPADILFPSGGALGQWVEMEGVRYLVVGILQAKGKFLGNDTDNTFVVPISILMRQRENIQAVDYFTVRPKSPTLTNEAKDEVTELLRRRRGVRADRADDFGITTQEALLDIYHQVTGAFYLVTILLSSIGLLVGGIGVMNMMLVSVKERTREIGVRAALGARRQDILGQFLLEAVSLTMVGGLLGIALGFSLAGVLHLTLHLPMAVTLPGIGIALGISATIGIFFGWYPAFRASRLDPVEALRYE